MKIGFVINDYLTEKADYTTTHLAMAATNLDHEVWYMSVGDFAQGPDETVHAHARRVPIRHHRESRVYLRELREIETTTLILDELDVLMLRNDPAEDAAKRPWARLAGINFGRLAMHHGVIVLNDPDGLMQAVNKMYLEYFPQEVRPLTLISRDREEIKAFVREQGEKNAVLKPLAGSGGHNVFLVGPQEWVNINQMIDAVCAEDYAIVQEYLPDAIHGDTRLFLMNGYPLRCEGRYAAFRRVRQPGDSDIRSNMTAGGVSQKAQVNQAMLHLAETIRPKLLQDGMFLVGLDIVDNRLMEINVFSPGGLMGAGQLEGVNFSRQVIHALERKVKYVRQYHQNRNFNNVEIAVL